MSSRLISIGLFAACSVPQMADTTATTSMQGVTDGTTNSASEATGQTSGESDPTESVDCPNGIVDAGESCDDGNLVDGDGCNTDCVESGTVLQEYRSSAAGNEAVYDLTIAPDGGIFIGGEKSKFRWVARLDSKLTIVWSELTENGGGDQAITGISADKTAIYAVGGVGESNAHDIWVGRYSLDGVLEWEDVSGEGGEDYASQVSLAQNGDVLVSALEETDDVSSLWLRRYSPDGSVLWTTSWPLSIGIKGFPLGPDLTLTSDAAFMGFSTFTADTAPEFVIQFPLAGGPSVWQLEIPETFGNILGLAALTGGDLVTTSSHLFETLTVRRVTNQGDISWSSSKCVGKSGRDIAVDKTGDIVVIGDGPGTIGNNIRLCKLAPDGSLRWGKDIDGGSGDDFGYSVKIDADNRIVAGGQMFLDTMNRHAWIAVFAP